MRNDDPDFDSPFNFDRWCERHPNVEIALPLIGQELMARREHEMLTATADELKRRPRETPRYRRLR